jgi:hypothetical protein
MNKMFIFIYFVSSITMMSGCKDSSPSQPSSLKTDIYPLTKGNTWVYFYAEYDLSGSITASYTTTANVRGDSTFWGHSMKLLWFEGDCWYANTDSGLIQYVGNGNNPPTNTFELLYQYPTARGNSYYIAGIVPVEVGSTDTLITVTAGTFHCIRYHFPGINTPFFVDHFVSPGIGLIKTATYNTNVPSHEYDGHELLSYSLK